MIDYGVFHFAGVPRSGSTWFMHACTEVGLDRGFKAHVHIPFRTEDVPTVLRVSLVRNPCNWLESYFKSIFPGKVGIPEIDVLSFGTIDKGTDLTGSFHNFINEYLQRCPGQVSKIFSSYNADSYLRIEDMPWAATELFTAIGIPPYIRNRCRRITPQNQSKVHIPKDRTVYYRVMEAEQSMSDQYEYF